jgi:broad specificity phosphatase PhoE
MRQVQRRVVEALLEIGDRHPDQTVVAVSRGRRDPAPRWCLPSACRSISMAASVSQGSISTIRIDAGGIRVLAINERPRLA